MLPELPESWKDSLPFANSSFGPVALIFLPMAVMLIALIVNGVLKVRQAKGWSQAQGRITRSRMASRSPPAGSQIGTTENVPDVAYNFSARGRTYQGNRVSLGNISGRFADEARTQDGVRAMQLVRSRAAEWKIDPARIGFAGFSAGSSLGRLVAAAAKAGDPAGADAIAKVSSRPDFLVLVYSAGRATPGEDLKTFPPTFLTCAAKDTGPANGSAQLFVELNKAGAIAEIHIYQQGRHGYGAALRSPEFSPWMPALRHFLQRGGFVPEQSE